MTTKPIKILPATNTTILHTTITYVPDVCPIKSFNIYCIPGGKV